MTISDDVKDLAVAIVSALTGLAADDATRAIDDAPTAGSSDAGADSWDRVERLVQQAPMGHDLRQQLLGDISHAPLDGSNGVGAAVLDAVHGRPLAIPTFDDSILMPPVNAELDAALRVLVKLDELVAPPWTLIGGLMVLLHCAEHDVPFTRPTTDADIVVSVFTHRDALAQLTEHLSALGFADHSPAPMGGGPQPSYRWVSEQAKVDVAVPPKANTQKRAPRSRGNRVGVELPATQQALRRTQRVPVRLDDGTTGWIRRPDLLGALVIKAAAALVDSRDADRHVEDFVVLADIIAATGNHVTFAPQMRAKDVNRINKALARCTPRHWTKARDPLAAQGALEFLTTP